MKHLCIALVKLYRKFISPLKRRGCCRFVPTCSQYAIEAFEKRGFFVGLILTVFRILRCNPYCVGGYDPVPETGLRYKGSREIPIDNDCDCGHGADHPAKKRSLPGRRRQRRRTGGPKRRKCVLRGEHEAVALAGSLSIERIKINETKENDNACAAFGHGFVDALRIVCRLRRRAHGELHLDLCRHRCGDLFCSHPASGRSCPRKIHCRIPWL